MNYRRAFLVIATIMMAAFGLYAAKSPHHNYNRRVAKFSSQTEASHLDYSRPGPKFRNQAEFDKALYQFHHRTIVDVYKKYGAHGFRWDKDAVEFLEDFTVAYYKSDDLANPKLMEEGKILADAGCQDPLLMSCYGILLVNGQPKEAKKLLEAALDGFAHSKYPKWRARIIPFYLSTADRDLQLVQWNDTTRWVVTAKYTRQIIDLSAECLHDGSYLPGEERFVLASFMPKFVTEEYIPSDFMGGHWGVVYLSVKDDKRVDPFMRDMIGAHYYISPAARVDLDNHKAEIAAARYQVEPIHVPSVHEEQLRNTDKKNNERRRLLLDAWKRHPEYPEVATEMLDLTNSLLQLGDNTQDPKTWFKRARAAQFDYTPAYIQYGWLLLPQWGGTPQEEYDFGVECLESRRFDTDVPLRFLGAINIIRRDYGKEKDVLRDYWFSEKTNKYLATMYAGYIKSGFRHDAKYWESCQAADDWCRGQFKEARRVLEKMGDSANQKAMLDESGAPYSIVKEDSYLLGCKYGADLIEARQLLNENKGSEALQIYREVLGKINDDDKVTSLIKQRIRFITASIDYDKGNWANIMPSHDLVGWTNKEGNWSVEPDGTLVGEASSWGSRLIYNRRVGTRLEISGEIGFPKTDAQAGIMLNVPGINPEWTAHYTHVLFGDRLRRIDVQKPMIGNSWVQNVDIKNPCTFLIQMWDDELNIYVDGRQVVKSRKIEFQENKGKSFIGINVNCFEGKSTLMLRNLRIRKLSVKP